MYIYIRILLFYGISHQTLGTLVEIVAKGHTYKTFISTFGFCICLPHIWGFDE